MELWERGRFWSAPPRDPSRACIEVWFNWNLVGSYRSYAEAQAKVVALLKTAPASLHDLQHYLEFWKR